MAAPQSSQGQCENCFMQETCYVLECGHKWCESCLASLTKIPTKCNTGPSGGNGCQREITAQFIERISLSPENGEKFDRVLNQMYLNTLRCQQCPCCNRDCVRESNKEQRVRCPKSSKDFCFFCGHEWRTFGHSGECGRPDGCPGDPWLKSLLTAPKKKIVAGSTTVEVWDTRMCPHCGSIWAHDSNCKHLRCGNCKNEFCFFCLSVKTNNAWPASCGSHSTACVVAPVQTEYPPN